ncbi:MAG: hypothetical protein EHM48_02405 [Planctomycetaceae bacterium]|nr:MAG: hypothetical protein EHM48_02405 [Planctomycetaceae bacterium]
MIYRIFITLFLSLVVVGCVAEKPSTQKMSTQPDTAKISTQPASRIGKEPLQGLQSLYRIQLKIEPNYNASVDDKKALQAEAVKQLREQLPQLDTSGTSDDWTLEFVFGVDTILGPDTSVGRSELSSTLTCSYRVFRNIVIDQRVATAVAYQVPVYSLHSVDRNRSLNPSMILQDRLLPTHNALLDNAIASFIAEWRVANPNAEQKSNIGNRLLEALAKPLSRANWLGVESMYYVP